MKRVQVFKMSSTDWTLMAPALGMSVSRCSRSRLRREDCETPMVRGWKLALGLWICAVDIWLTLKEVP